MADIGTITNLRLIRDKIKEGLKDINVSDYSDSKYGKEQEYTAKGIKVGVTAILHDITGLTKSPNKFIQKSSHKERSDLVQNLKNISLCVANENLDHLARHIDIIKPILRDLGARYTDERLEAFIEHTNNLQKKSETLSQAIKDFKEDKTKNETLIEELSVLRDEGMEKINKLNVDKELLENRIIEIESKRDSLSEMLSEDENRTEQIIELFTSSKSHEEVIKSFSGRVEKRENQLVSQETKTTKYEEKLDEFSEKQNEILTEAEGLIESARTALQYSTAKGMSEAFSTKYDEAKESRLLNSWLTGAGLFLISAVSVGIWIFWAGKADTSTLVGRISLIPLLMAGAWFCAGQYVKQKNIAEDYGYKTVLAKSIVGFSDQLSSQTDKGEEYTNYIKSVLEQIHNDPLRKHGASGKVSNKTDVNATNKVLKEIENLKNILDDFVYGKRKE